MTKEDVLAELESYRNANTIKKAGFSIIDIQHDSFEYKFVDGTTMLNHYSIRMAFLDGWKSIIPIEMQERVFELIEQKISKRH